MSDDDTDRMAAYVTTHENGISVDVEGMLTDAIMIVKVNKIPKKDLLNLVNYIYDNMEVKVTYVQGKRTIN